MVEMRLSTQAITNAVANRLSIMVPWVGTQGQVSNATVLSQQCHTHQPPSARPRQDMQAFLFLPARTKGTLSKSAVLASIHRICQFQVGIISWRVCSPSHTALAARPETATDRTPTHPQSRWHSSLPFVILIVGNVRDSLHNTQEEDLAFLKRLPRVEVIFILPPHTAFTACVYSKDKNHRHAEKALPGCSQRAAMPKKWNAFREERNVSRHLRQNTKEALEDKFGNNGKCCNNATIYAVVFLKTYNNAGGCPVSWEQWDKTERPSYVPTRPLLCVPLLGSFVGSCSQIA